MDLKPVTSSTVAAVGYDAATKTLAVRFLSGGLYHYAGVTAEAHGALMSAKSIGQFVHHSIKPFHKVAKQPEPTPKEHTG